MSVLQHRVDPLPFSVSQQGHHAVPAGPQDWLLLAFAAVLVLLLTLLSLRLLLRPGESDPDHVKRRILTLEAGEGGPWTSPQRPD